MNKLKYGTKEYDEVLARAEKLSYSDLLELTKRIGVRFETPEPLVEDLLGVLDEGDKNTILALLDELGV